MPSHWHGTLLSSSFGAPPHLSIFPRCPVTPPSSQNARDAPSAQNGRAPKKLGISAPAETAKNKPRTRKQRGFFRGYMLRLQTAWYTWATVIIMVSLCKPSAGARCTGRAQTLPLPPPRVSRSHLSVRACFKRDFSKRLLAADSAPNPAADSRPGPAGGAAMPGPPRAPSHGAPRSRTALPHPRRAGLPGPAAPSPAPRPCAEDPSPAVPRPALRLGPARPRLAPPAAEAGPARAALTEPRGLRAATRERRGAPRARQSWREEKENEWKRAGKCPAVWTPLDRGKPKAVAQKGARSDGKVQWLCKFPRGLEVCLKVSVFRPLPCSGGP